MFIKLLSNFNFIYFDIQYSPQIFPKKKYNFFHKRAYISKLFLASTRFFHMNKCFNIFKQFWNSICFLNSIFTTLFLRCVEDIYSDIYHQFNITRVTQQKCTWITHVLYFDGWVWGGVLGRGLRVLVLMSMLMSAVTTGKD